MKWQSAGVGRRETFILPSKDFAKSNSSNNYNSTKYPQSYLQHHNDGSPHPFASYSVTRINPLFVEENKNITGNEKNVIATAAISENQNNCCEAHSLYTSPLKEDKLNILNQNRDFVKSILISNGLKSCHTIPGETDELKNYGGASERLPPVIWPRNETDEENRTDYYDVSKSIKESILPTNVPTMQTENYEKSVPEILTELSVSINEAIDNMRQYDHQRPTDNVVQSIRGNILRTLEALSTSSENNDCFTNKVSSDNVVATLSRAFGFVNAFKTPSSSYQIPSHRHHNIETAADEVETGRLQLLKRLGRLTPYDPYYDHLNQKSSSSNSSTASTSGFSDLTHTPTQGSSSTSSSSPSESPSASRIVENNLEAQNAVFIKNNNNKNKIINNNNIDINNHSNSSSSSESGRNNDDKRLMIRSNVSSIDISNPSILSFGTLQYKIIQTDSSKSSVPSSNDYRLTLFNPTTISTSTTNFDQKFSPLQHGKELVTKAETLLSDTGFSWSNVLGMVMQLLFNQPSATGPSKSDAIDADQNVPQSPWTNLLSVGLKILTAFLGGGPIVANDGIDKIDNSSPMQGVLSTVLSAVLGSKDPEQVAAMAKQAGEFINIVVNLLDALKTSFSHRSMAARSLGKKDSFSDATLAGITLFKGYVRTMRTSNDKCMQKYICDANKECADDLHGANTIYCQLGTYASSVVLQKTSSLPFEAFYDAGRKGRSGEDCHKLYLECTQEDKQ